MKLNLGCGDKFLSGYVNIDLIEPSFIPEGIDFKIGDATKLDAFRDETVDEIYASHILDHFSRDKEIDKALDEWYCVLKPNGILRVAVSDFEKTAKMYNEGVDLEGLWGAIVGGHKSKYDQHGCAFDFNVLRRYLEKHGFIDVQRYRWQDFLPKGFEDNSCAAIPKYELDGYLMSLNVVAKKKPKEENVG